MISPQCCKRLVKSPEVIGTSTTRRRKSRDQLQNVHVHRRLNIWCSLSAASKDGSSADDLCPLVATILLERSKLINHALVLPASTFAGGLFAMLLTPVSDQVLACREPAISILEERPRIEITESVPELIRAAAKYVYCLGRRLCPGPQRVGKRKSGFFKLPPFGKSEQEFEKL
jgi:hypothetical protein